MGLTKQQRSNRYYRSKIERALYYLDLAADFERLSTQSSAAPAPIRTTKPKARRLGKCFGKVSRSNDLEGVILMLLSSLYLSGLTYVPIILSTHSFQIVNVIQIPTSVSIVYDAIGRSSQITSGTYSLCYGEITPASIQSLCYELVRLSLVSPGSLLLELGAGVGKPSLHFSSFFRCLTVGIEIDYPLYFASLGNLKKVYSKADELGFQPPSVAFVHSDISNLSSFDPFEVIYSFDCLFEPALLMHIGRVFNDSSKCKVFMSYKKPAVLQDLGFIGLRLMAKLPMKMIGSRELKTCFVYTRRIPERSDSQPDPIVCDILAKHSNGTLVEANRAIDIQSLGGTVRKTRSRGSG